MPDDSVELNQLIGAALRDVAKARFTADLFSRQISFQYERDPLLRRFPVPRVEIEEAEIELVFAVMKVEKSEGGVARNAAVSSLFSQYGSQIARAGAMIVRDAVRAKLGVDAARNVEAQYLSEDRIEAWTGRIVSYLNESREVLAQNAYQPERVANELAENAKQTGIPYADALRDALRGQQLDWDTNIIPKVAASRKELLDQLALDIKDVWTRYPDYKLMVDPSPGPRADGPPVSTIKIKSSVKNYSWSKVDVDPADMRNIRTLNRE